MLFFPDQHLGRWTGYLMDIPLAEMLVWDPDEELGGLTPQQIKMAKILLWKGHCSVHQMFQPQHIVRWREQNPSGMVISHPECKFDVCKLSDYVGSTDFIIRTVAASPPGTRWLVGTELNLVNRIAEQFKPQGKVVQFMAPTVCMCSTMARIDPQHLAWTLENLVAGKVVNQIKVPARRSRSRPYRARPHARGLLRRDPGCAGITPRRSTSRKEIALPGIVTRFACDTSSFVPVGTGSPSDAGSTSS